MTPTSGGRPGPAGLAFYQPPSPLADHIARSLHASGAMLAYHRYPGRGHFDLTEAAHTENAQWIGTRLAEMPLRRPCDGQPARTGRVAHELAWSGSSPRRTVSRSASSAV